MKVPNDTCDTVEEELKLKPYIDLVYRYSGVGEGYRLADTTDFGDIDSLAKDPKRIGAAPHRPQGVEINGRWHNHESVRKFLGDQGEVPF